MTVSMPDGWSVDEVNRWLAYHGESTKAMTAQRTSLESKLIPITAYVVIAAVECYRRHPELVVEIERAMTADDIGAAGRRPGTQVDSVHIWSQANIFLLGRQILMMMGMLRPDEAPERCAVVLDFWKRASAAFRADGYHQAFDGGLRVTPYLPEVIEQLDAGAVPVTGDAWASVKRLNALLTTYLFLLYFDTRSGYQDTGPYELPGGGVLLVRDFVKMGPSDFWWSEDVAAGLPYTHLTMALVLDDVRLSVNDWGTSITEPADYLDRVSRFGLFTTDGGTLRPVALDEVDAIRSATKDAQTGLYRLVAKMSRKERIDAGAYVYFTFLRPFAEVAGVAGDLDWTVPRDSLDVYDVLSAFEGSNSPPDTGDLPYYWPFPAP